MYSVILNSTERRLLYLVNLLWIAVQVLMWKAEQESLAGTMVHLLVDAPVEWFKVACQRESLS